MTTTNHTSPALTDEQIRNIENDQAKMPGVTRENLTARTVRAALIAQHGFCLDEDQCTCAREIGYRVCQPNDHTSHIGEDAANVAIGEREAFERELVKRIPGAQLQLRDADDEFRPGEYEHATHEFAWRMWQARAALTAEKVAAEPVAWFIADDNGEVYRATGYEHERDQWRAVGHEVFPLYAAPQQPAQSAEQDERAAFESDYAKVWNAAMKENGWSGDHTADDVKDLRDGNTYGKGRDYLNARWEGWQARALLAAQPVSGQTEGNQ